MNKHIISTIAYASLIPLATFGQSTADLQVIASEHVSVGAPSRPHFESFLAVDPGDPKHMTATAILDREEAPPGEILRMSSDAYVTFDGGKHWEQATFGPMDSTLRNGIAGAGDPSVMFGGDRTPYLVLYGSVHGHGKVLVSRSRDGGRTWDAPFPTGNADRPFMAMDTSAFSSFSGAMYLAGQVGPLVISTSLDSGRTWTARNFLTDLKNEHGEPVPIPPGIAGDIVTSPKGAVGVTITDAAMNWITKTHTELARNGVDTMYVGHVSLVVSENGGRSWYLRQGPPQAYVSGRRGFEGLGSARAMVDLTNGPHRGRLYVSYTTYSDSLDRHIVQLARSDDFGKTWAVTTVSDTAIRGAANNATVALNKSGLLVVAWYDRRDDPAHHCWRLYGALSVDGGVTMRSNVPLSTKPTCVARPGSWIPFAEVHGVDSSRTRPRISVTAHTRENGGETFGLVADSTGVFHAGWINGETGITQIWHTSFAAAKRITDSLRTAARAALGARPGPTPPGERVDLTRHLRLQTKPPVFDFKRGVMTIPLRVNNTTAFALRSPITVELAELVDKAGGTLGLKHLRVGNSENGKPGVGAVWSFRAAVDTIPAGGSTEWGELRFLFDPITDTRPLDITKPFDPAFNIYGRY